MGLSLQGWLRCDKGATRGQFESRCPDELLSTSHRMRFASCKKVFRLGNADKKLRPYAILGMVPTYHGGVVLFHGDPNCTTRHTAR